MKNYLLAAGFANYLLYIIALGLIVYFSVRALKKGFVGCLFSFLSTIVSLLLAFSLAHGLTVLTDGFFGVQDALNSEILATLVSGVALFLLCKLIFFLLRTIITAVLDRMPVAGKVNRLLGFFVGLFQGLFILYGVLALFALLPVADVSEFFSECLLLEFMFFKNPIFSALAAIALILSMVTETL